MKKLISLLLCAVICLSFVACGGGSGNTETPPSGDTTGETEMTKSPPSDDTVDQTETIEITFDNWENYFEIKFDANFIKNPFGDVISVESGIYLYLRSEYFDRLVSANVHFDLETTNGPDYIYSYDLQTGTVTVERVNDSHGIPYAFYGLGSSICTYRYDSTHTADNIIIQISPQLGSGVSFTETNIHTVQMSGSVAKWVARKWETIEVAGVLGDITLIARNGAN